MKAFAALYTELDSATSTQRKLAALGRYFAQAAPANAAWATYFLAGGKPRQSVKSSALRFAAAEAAAIPEWLFEECYDAVGDMAETIALLLPDASETSDIPLAECITTLILPLRLLPLEAQMAGLRTAWSRLDSASRFVFNKLITGSFRVGVSRLLVTQALAKLSEVDANIIAQRMMGYLASNAQPTADDYLKLTASHNAHEPDAQPFPFFLAQSLQSPPENSLGEATEWLVEWKWDGMRGQLVKRGGSAQLWSRGDELISERFPELMEMAAALPDGCVLDGEVIGWDSQSDAPLPFAKLQTRMARKKVGAKLMADVPIVFIAYDLLEYQGVDIRSETMATRRALLVGLVDAVNEPRLKLSAAIQVTSWAQLAEVRREARERGAEGLMLKRLDSAYGVGRTKRQTRGEWWKWKLDPMSVDAVLIYAQRGHGRRASLYTDYSFAVWDDNNPDSDERKLVPFAKAYSGLTDAEIREVDAFVRRNTLEKFGPVRTVKPELVMEIGFEGIQVSKRHKSGVAVRFPRILRVRNDKPMEEADTLESLKALAGVG
ncbi:MAG: ATP-dependent ligase [Rhodocyclales bacterium]|nr:ATP-dependent ligase [Rhodocyclales bacterium]